MKKILSLILSLGLLFVLGVALSGCTPKDSIVFYVDGEKYATKKTITDFTVELPEDPIKEGYKFIGWYDSEDSALSKWDIRKIKDENEQIVGALDVGVGHCNKYHAVFDKLYEISFDLSDGRFTSTELEKSADDFILQEDGTYCVYEVKGGYVQYLTPYRKGYSFKGWSLNDEIVYDVGATDNYATVKGDVCFVAVWEANEYSLSVYGLETWNENYTVYNSNGYDFEETKSEKVCCDNEISLTFDLKDGYEFACWYNAGERWKGYYSLIQDFNPENIISTERNCSISMPASNCCIVAIYYPYRFSASIYGDEQAGTISQVYSGVIAKEGEVFTLTACANAGYTFQGWYLNGTLLIKENTVNYEMTNCSAILTAKFGVCSTTVSATKKYSQTSNEYKDNSYIILPDDFGTNFSTYTVCAKLIDNYLFYGWYLNGELLTQDLILDIEIGMETAEYVAKYVKCNTYFSKNIDDAANLDIPDLQYYGQEIKVTANINKGHKFEGWYITDSATSEQQLVTESVVLEIVLSDDTKNYIAKFSENTLTITQNIEGAGTLLEGFKVTFDYGYTYEDQIQIVNSKTQLQIPEKKTRYDEILVGWYLDEDFTTPFDWSSPVNSDLTLYAKWEDLTVPWYVNTHGTYIEMGESVISIIDETNSSEKVCYFYAADYDQTVHLQMLTYRLVSHHNFNIYANVEIYNATTKEVLYGESLYNTGMDYSDDIITQNLTITLKQGDILRIEYYFGGAGSDGIGFYPISQSTEYFQFRILLDSEKPLVYGDVNCVDGHYHAGEAILLKTDLKEGCNFDGWYIDEVCIGTALEMEYTMPDTSVVVEARYSIKESDSIE